MILDPLTSLKVALTAAKSATDMDITVDYIDYNQQGEPTPPATYRTHSNGTSDVTILPAAPTGALKREPIRISIYNADNADKTMVLKTDDGSTQYGIWKVAITLAKAVLWEKRTQWQFNV